VYKRHVRLVPAASAAYRIVPVTAALHSLSKCC